MTEHPRRPVITLGHLNRASAVLIALQLAFGAALAILLGSILAWATFGAAGLAGFREVSDLPTSLLTTVEVFGVLLLMNVVGLAMWRLIAFVRSRLTRRKKD